MVFGANLSVSRSDMVSLGETIQGSRPRGARGSDISDVGDSNARRRLELQEARRRLELQEVFPKVSCQMSVFPALGLQDMLTDSICMTGSVSCACQRFRR